MNINPRMLVNSKGKLLHDVFVPLPLQEIEKKIVFDIDVLTLLMEANEAITRLHNAYQGTDPYLREYFYDYCLKKETLASLLISGNNLTLENFYTADLGSAADVGYRFYQVAKAAAEETGKLNNDFLKNLHRRIVNDKNARPGHYRIGRMMIYTYYRHNRYNPPFDEELESSMNALEEYINRTANTNYLIKAALVHYQLTTIHPFHDGNDRLARLFNMLYLKRSNPCGPHCFYMSNYFAANLSEYYDALTAVRSHGHFQGWVEYYLKAITATSNHMRNIIDFSLTLLKRNHRRILETPHSNTIKNNLISALEYMVFNPVTTVNRLSEIQNKSFPAAARNAKLLAEMGILETAGFCARSRLYVYREQLDILRD
jgi:Fic family protein